MKNEPIPLTKETQGMQTGKTERGVREREAHDAQRPSNPRFSALEVIEALVQRLTASIKFGSYNGQDVALARDRLIAQANEIERLTRELAAKQQSADVMANLTDRVQAERDRLRAALERFMAHPAIPLCECGEPGCATRQAREALSAERPADETTDSERIEFLQRWIEKTKARGHQWDTFAFNVQSDVRSQIDAAMKAFPHYSAVNGTGSL